METKSSKPPTVKCQYCKFFFDKGVCPMDEKYLLDTSITCDKFEQQSLKDKTVYPDYSIKGNTYTLLKNL